MSFRHCDESIAQLPELSTGFRHSDKRGVGLNTPSALGDLPSFVFIHRFYHRWFVEIILEYHL